MLLVRPVQLSDVDSLAELVTLTRGALTTLPVDRDLLIRQLGDLGYQRVDAVAEAGEYAVRGSLIDLFPAGSNSGLRLDFFGDEIESLRRFDPAMRTVQACLDGGAVQIQAGRGLVDAELLDDAQHEHGAECLGQRIDRLLEQPASVRTVDAIRRYRGLERDAA